MSKSDNLVQDLLTEIREVIGQIKKQEQVEEQVAKKAIADLPDEFQALFMKVYFDIELLSEEGRQALQELKDKGIGMKQMRKHLNAMRTATYYAMRDEKPTACKCACCKLIGERMQQGKPIPGYLLAQIHEMMKEIVKAAEKSIFSMVASFDPALFNMLLALIFGRLLRNNLPLELRSTEESLDKLLKRLFTDCVQRYEELMESDVAPPLLPFERTPVKVSQQINAIADHYKEDGVKKLDLNEGYIEAAHRMHRQAAIDRNQAMDDINDGGDTDPGQFDSSAE